MQNQDTSSDVLSMTSGSMKLHELSNLLMFPPECFNKQEGSLDIEKIDTKYEPPEPQLIKKSTQRELIDEMGGYDQQCMTYSQALKSIDYDFQAVRYNILHNEIGHLEISMLFHSLTQQIFTCDSL